MIITSIRSLVGWTAIIGGCLCSASSLAYCGQHHTPYVDRFSPGASTQGVATTASPVGMAGVDDAGCASGNCGGGMAGEVGRRSAICPLPTRASLKLWVPENASVCINDQPTKCQSLGGVHSGSRIYNLAGLDSGPIMVCIVVECCRADGQIEKGQHEFLAEAGAKYEFRYPTGFMKLASVELQQEVAIEGNIEIQSVKPSASVIPNQAPVRAATEDSFTPPPVSSHE